MSQIIFPSITLTPTTPRSSGPSGSSSRIVYASKTSALDVDLTTGLQRVTGITATDDTWTINAALVAATSTSPISYVLDGAALSRTVLLPAAGHVTLEGTGWETGIFTQTGTNNDSVHNGGPGANVPFDGGTLTPPIPVPKILGGDVTIKNLRVSGNRGDGKTGNCTGGDPRVPVNAQSVFATGINLMDLNRVTLRDVMVDDCATYNVKMSNVHFVDVDNFYASRSKGDRPLNTDGLHFSGPCSEIRISNSVFECGDDPIALNAPEGRVGTISRVLVANCSMRNCLSMMRVYAALTPALSCTVDAVKIVNCIGDCYLMGFNLGYGIGVPGNYPGATHAISSFMAENITILTPLLAQITNNVGYLELSGIDWTLPRGGGGYGIRIGGASVVDTIRLNGFRVTPVAGGPALQGLFASENGDSSHFVHVIIDSLDTQNIQSLTYGAFPITSLFTKISGVGVLATGWEFPDSVMANDTLYLSATSHLPSVKIGGVVKTVTIS